MEDFSYPFDPSHPEGLQISVDVSVLGLPKKLHFVSVPQVRASPQLSLIQNDPSSPYFAEVQGQSRTGPPNAPADLPGGFRDPDRFVAHFNTQDFFIGANKYSATIDDLRFETYSDPLVPISTYPGNPHNPIDFEPAVFKLTVDTIG